MDGVSFNASESGSAFALDDSYVAEFVAQYFYCRELTVQLLHEAREGTVDEPTRWTSRSEVLDFDGFGLGLNYDSAIERITNRWNSLIEIKAVSTPTQGLSAMLAFDITKSYLKMDSPIKLDEDVLSSFLVVGIASLRGHPESIDVVQAEFPPQYGVEQLIEVKRRVLAAFELHPFLEAAAYAFEVPGVDSSLTAEVRLTRSFEWIHVAYPFYAGRRNAPGGDLQLYVRPLCVLIEEPWTLEWPLWHGRSSGRINKRYERKELRSDLRPCFGRNSSREGRRWFILVHNDRGGEGE